MVTADAMTSFVGVITAFFTEALDWVTSVLGTITGDPALLVLCIAMPVCGFAIGLLGRILRA